ncbi:MAG: hypothetical protein ACTSQP_05330 [Promethearchaeota archaeon]
MKAKSDYIINKKRNNAHWLFWGIAGILFFIAFYYPFFGATLKYSTASIIKKATFILGMACITIGGVSIVLGFFSIFWARSVSPIKLMVFGAIFFYLGVLLVNPGVLNGSDSSFLGDYNSSSKGYN